VSNRVTVPLEEALDFMTEDCTVGLGGYILSAHPFAVVFEMVRRRLAVRRVVGAAAAGLEVDLILAAGLTRELVTSHVGAEHVSPVGPAYARLLQQEAMDVFVCDEGIYFAALRAGAAGLPSSTWRSGPGTDLVELNHRLIEHPDPLTGEPVLVVPPITIDVLYVHVDVADVEGNVAYRGSGFGDRAMHAASRVTVAVAEELLPPNCRLDSSRVAFRADRVVWRPYGAYPFAAPGRYTYDADWLRSYVGAVRTEEEKEFLDRCFATVPSHADFLERVGMRRLLHLGDPVRFAGLPT
jgi:glutaconate CoA-transferase, subunit A